jgi:hypothetical protein
LFIPFYYLLFLDKPKIYILHDRFAFNNHGPQIEHIVGKKMQ